MFFFQIQGVSGGSDMPSLPLPPCTGSGRLRVEGSYRNYKADSAVTRMCQL